MSGVCIRIGDHVRWMDQGAATHSFWGVWSESGSLSCGGKKSEYGSNVAVLNVLHTFDRFFFHLEGVELSIGHGSTNGFECTAHWMCFWVEDGLMGNI
jgi:hypothetical protein